MPRRHRRQLPGALYHVGTRGNRRQPIVLTDRDCVLFLFLVADVVARLQWSVHSYCVMPNHYHLLVETPNGDISNGMQLLNGRFAQIFNRRHGYEGHLFERRFFDEVVESEWHLLEVTRYVVLNPVRAGLCRHPGEWEWSSYRATVGRSPCPKFLTTELLGMFGHDDATAIVGFEQFVAAGMLTEDVSAGDTGAWPLGMAALD